VRRPRFSARAALRFIAAAVVGNYVVVLLASGIGIVGALFLTFASGLSGASGAALFIGVALILTAVSSIASRRLIPATWLEPPPSATPASVRAVGDPAELRQALNAVRDELLLVEELMRQSFDSGEFPSPYDADHRVLLPDGAWVNNRARIAAVPSLQDTYDLARAAYSEIGNLNRGVRKRIPTTRDEAVDVTLPVWPEENPQIEAILGAIAPSIDALERAREGVTT
jgi:hypothetical protein